MVADGVSLICLSEEGFFLYVDSSLKEASRERATLLTATLIIASFF